MFIDTHCHLDFKDFDADRDAVIERARAAGVDIIINVGSSLEGSRRAVQIAKKYDNIYASVGVHPHDVKSVTADTFSEIKRLAASKKIVAIGEVGLDYYRDLSPRDIQKRIFREFIRLAKELNLPLILHNRDSHQDMLAVLKEEFAGARIRGVMHCFSGDEIFLKECLDLGLFISFTCNITYKNADKLRSVARAAPVEKVLIETDAPFLSPQNFRGQRNEPAYVTYAAQELSKVQGLSVEDIGRITARNARELFGLEVVESVKIAYPIRDSLYLNITNRCTNDCYFCVRAFSDFVKGHKLNLDKEPSVSELLDAIGNADNYREIVFCGYGEPTLRLDVIKEVSRTLKQKGKAVRLVTNGHGNLINERPIAKELAGLVDKLSVSLNVDNSEKYSGVCKPKFKGNVFEEIKRFIAESKEAGIAVEVTCLDIPEADIDKCRFIAEKELGVAFRLRRHNVVG